MNVHHDGERVRGDWSARQQQVQCLGRIGRARVGNVTFDPN